MLLKWQFAKEARALKERHIRNIQILHDFSKTGVQLWVALSQLEEQSEGSIGGPMASAIVFADNLDSQEETKRALLAYREHEFKDDLFLVLTKTGNRRSKPDAIVIKTNSGYTIIGPNDGSLGCVPKDDIKELRIITQPWHAKEFFRRLFAAASIAKGVPPDEFSRVIKKRRLKR